VIDFHHGLLAGDGAANGRSHGSTRTLEKTDTTLGAKTCHTAALAGGRHESGARNHWLTDS